VVRSSITNLLSKYLGNVDPLVSPLFCGLSGVIVVPTDPKILRNVIITAIYAENLTISGFACRCEVFGMKRHEEKNRLPKERPQTGGEA
jgi:hypothetical protein